MGRGKLRGTLRLIEDSIGMSGVPRRREEREIFGGKGIQRAGIEGLRRE